MLARFARSNVVSGPVFDRDEARFLGFLDLLDVVTAILAWFPPKADPALLTAIIKKAGGWAGAGGCSMPALGAGRGRGAWAASEEDGAGAGRCLQKWGVACLPSCGAVPLTLA